MEMCWEKYFLIKDGTADEHTQNQKWTPHLDRVSACIPPACGHLEMVSPENHFLFINLHTHVSKCVWKTTLFISSYTCIQVCVYYICIYRESIYFYRYREPYMCRIYIEREWERESRCTYMYTNVATNPSMTEGKIDSENLFCFMPHACCHELAHSICICKFNIDINW